MAPKIVWDAPTKRVYETGVDHGVLYPIDTVLGTYPLGVAWNGITSVSEAPSGGEATPLWADNIKYLNLVSSEQFGATLEAYTYPDEFGACDGSVEPVDGLALGQQGRKTFGLAYRTRIGNDAEGDSYGYKLHLIYGALAAPSQKAYATVNDTPSAIAFSWTVTTSPVPVSNRKPVASMTIDSTRVDPTKLAALEAILYGTASPDVDGRLPLPDEVISILTETAPSALSVAVVPLDEASGVAVTANVVLTFNNKIARESVVVASAGGVIVAVGRSWDATGKVLTLDPTVNLTGGTTYIVTVAGVVDIYAQSLASSVLNFATV